MVVYCILATVSLLCFILCMLVFERRCISIMLHAWEYCKNNFITIVDYLVIAFSTMNNNYPLLQSMYFVER